MTGRRRGRARVSSWRRWRGRTSCCTTALSAWPRTRCRRAALPTAHDSLLPRFRSPPHIGSFAGHNISKIQPPNCSPRSWAGFATPSMPPGATALSLSALCFLSVIMNQASLALNGFHFALPRPASFSLCSEALALDPASSTALHRRGQARAALDSTTELEQGVADLQAALRLEPTGRNAELEAELRKHYAALQQQRKRDHATFSGMFARGRLYDDRSASAASAGPSGAPGRAPPTGSNLGRRMPTLKPLPPLTLGSLRPGRGKASVRRGGQGSSRTAPEHDGGGHAKGQRHGA